MTVTKHLSPIQSPDAPTATDANSFRASLGQIAAEMARTIDRAANSFEPSR
jgi:hypothetical protein